jgi:peroxiredoxin
MTESSSFPTRSDRIRTGLLALTLGLLLPLVMILLIKFISNDMRWLLWLGAAGLYGAALWLGRLRRGGAVSLLLLCLPLLLVYGLLVVPELPGLWPHLLLWLGFALAGWYGFRLPGRARTSTLVALLALVVGGFWYGQIYVPAEISRSLSHFRNDPAPEYSLMNLDGTPYPMESLEGRVVILDFFATWCAPCIAELPELDELRHEFEDSDDVKIVVVANDSGGDTPEAISEFIRERNLELPFAYDPEGKAHSSFGFAGLPGLVVMDPAGNIRLTREGYNAAETQFQENLMELVESLRPAG